MLKRVRVIEAKPFTDWLANLRDREAQRRINRRIEQLRANDHFGIWKSVGSGIAEIKLAYGPGYRLYFTRRDGAIVLLLLGGDKSTQQRDILEAKRIASAFDEG